MLAAAAERLRRSHTIFLLLVKTEPIVPCGLCSYSASPSSVGVSQDQNRGLLPHAPPPHLFLRNATLNGDYNHTYPAKSNLYPTHPIPITYATYHSPSACCGAGATLPFTQLQISMSSAATTTAAAMSQSSHITGAHLPET